MSNNFKGESILSNYFDHEIAHDQDVTGSDVSHVTGSEHIVRPIIN